MEKRLSTFRVQGLNDATRLLVGAGAVAAVGIIAVKLLYLAIEFYYNRTLIEFAGARYITETQVDNIELFGHNLAALGASLLIVPLLFRRLHCRFTRVGAKALLAVGLYAISHTAVYQAQTLLLDSLVDRAGVRTQYNAYYLNIIRGLLARGDLVHPGIIPSPEDIGTRDKLMLAQLPLAAATDPQLIENVRTSGAAALENYLRERALREDFSPYWAKYLKARQGLDELWAGYRRLLTEAEKGLSNPDKEAAALYGELLKAGESRYEDYRKLSQAFATYRAKQSTSLPRFYAQLQTYFSSPTGARWRDVYVPLMEEMFGYQVRDENYWCDGNRCPGSSSYVRRQVEALWVRQFQSSSGGFVPGLAKADFLNHEAFRDALSEAAEQRGLSVPASAFSDLTAFVAAYRAAAEHAAASQARAEFDERTGIDVPPGLNAEEFASHPAVVAKFSSQLPEALQGHPLTYTKAEFFDRLWRPEAERRIQEAIAKSLPADPAVFDKPEWEETGRKAVKMMYILPLALFFSAAMGFLNAASALALVLAVVGISVYARVQARRGREARFSRTPVRAAMVGVASLSLALPLASDGLVLEDRPAAEHYYMQGMEERPVLFALLTWLNTSERFAHEAGTEIRANLPLSVSLRLDRAFLGAD